MAPCENCQSNYSEVNGNPIGYDCNIIQSYCAINGQRASNNLTNIDSLYPAFSSGTSINASDFNSIKTILTNIYNYGAKGTRNPSTSGIATATSNNKTLLSEYNSILQALQVPQQIKINSKTYTNNGKTYTIFSGKKQTYNIHQVPEGADSQYTSGPYDQDGFTLIDYYYPIDDGVVSLGTDVITTAATEWSNYFGYYLLSEITERTVADLLTITGPDAVRTVDYDDLTGTQSMSNALMERLKILIKNYRLNNDRCYVCNTSVNCYQGGSGGGGTNIECVGCYIDCSGCDSQ